MANRILLTGGAGYIGSHIYLALVAAGFRPLILDNFSASDPGIITALEAISGCPVEFIKGDVRDGSAVRAVLEQGGFVAAVHLAALKSVQESVAAPIGYFENNIGGLMSLVRSMAETGLRTLVFSSSATVYGAPRTRLVRENASRGFTNPYGFTKLAGEQMLDMIAASDERWKIGVLRYFNPAGAHESGLIGEWPDTRTTNLFPSIAKVALGRAALLDIYGDDYPTRDGSAERDFIHVQDLEMGHLLSLRCLLEEARSHKVNLGTGHGHTVLEVLQEYERASHKKIPYRIVGRRPGDVASSVADPGLALRTLGFRARRGLREMCESGWQVARRAG